MLELPEVLTMAKQLKESVVDKKVVQVYPPSKEHKFCWYHGDPQDYHILICGKRIVSANGFGIFVEIEFEDDYKLCFNDGVNVRYIPAEKAPKHYQLMIEFEDKTALVFTVAMYGGIILHKGEYENEYYLASKQAIGVFSLEFKEYYHNMIQTSKQTLSLKAFLATEQRFPGIGNGVLQDILFEANLNPRRQLSSLTEEEKYRLLKSILCILQAMIDEGGRDTEKDLWGNTGRYRTKMSRHTIAMGCPVCRGEIIKEAYLGGSVYFCLVCQPKIL